MFRACPVIVTPQAQTAMAHTRTRPETLLVRHMRGDWGSISPVWRARGLAGIHTRGRVLGIYQVGYEQTRYIAVETDFALNVTRIALCEEWATWDAARHPERETPEVVALTERATALQQELAQIQAGRARVGLAEARRAADDAATRLGRLVAGEATGTADAAAMKRAERDVEKATAQVAIAERKAAALEARLVQAQRELEGMTREREHAEQAAREATEARERQIADLLLRYEVECRVLTQRVDQLIQDRTRLRSLQAQLDALGAKTNHGFLSGAGAALEAAIAGTEAVKALDRSPWPDDPAGAA
jgi:hypothetical protein